MSKIGMKKERMPILSTLIKQVATMKDGKIHLKSPEQLQKGSVEKLKKEVA